jgi:CMP-N-acetylneuraminic acid synthetase
MYKNKKVIAFIPARKGSKRVKNKNGVIIDGKPLFQYSIDVAKKSKYIDKIFFSTDSEEWLEYAHKIGCEKNGLRPEYLSDDKSRIIDAIMYEIETSNFAQYDAIVLLQPTSPYRTVEMLDKAIEEYFKTETSLITIVEAEEQPIFMRKMVDGKLAKIIESSSDIRSQDFDKIYRIIGNIYINNIKNLTRDTVLNENEIGFIIDKEFAIDIDTVEDLEYAKNIIENMKASNK